MIKRKQPVAIVGKAYSFHDVIAEAIAKQEAEEKRIAAMSPEDFEEYKKQCAKDDAEAAKIIAELQGMGEFMGFGVRRK